MELQIKQIILSSEDPVFSNSDNPNCDATDVIVLMSNDSIYFAPFYSFKKIEEIRKELDQKGELLKSKYFWVENLVLIENCTSELIREVINDMINEGDFFNAFKIL